MQNITELPSGNLRVRVEYAGKVVAKTFAADAYADARRWRDAIKLELAEGDIEPASGATMKSLGAKFLASRSGHRDSKTDGSRWYMHVATASWAHKPAAAVTRADGLAWLEELRSKRTAYDPKKHGQRTSKPLAWDTRRKCLNLARCAFTWAIDHGKIAMTTNPFLELEVKREDGDEDEGYQEGWYLNAEEQRWFLSLWDTLVGLDMRDRVEKWIVACGITLGLRLGELWCLHLADVHLEGDEPHIVVRFGSWDPVKERYRAPKGKAGEKKSRIVPLWGPGLEAMKRWLEILPTYASKNPHGLVFPTERGARRDKKPPRSWKTIAKVFGTLPRIGRPVWWHLLRHTCASSLVSGWWGIRWSLEDVQKILGHADLRTTQRYAHLTPAAVAATAARAHEAYVGRHAAVTPRRGASRSSENRWHARQDSNLRPTAPEAVALSS